jgi:predicted nucleic acid-binding protein
VAAMYRASTRRYVLDANALIGFFEDRQSASQKVRRLMSEAFRQESPLLMSAVNWGEVFYMEWRYHGEIKAREVEENLQRLPILVVAADTDRATRAAALKQKHNLGYADAFAAELALERGAWLVTADPEFSRMGKTLSLYPLPQHERKR